MIKHLIGPDFGGLLPVGWLIHVLHPGTTTGCLALLALRTIEIRTCIGRHHDSR